MRALSMNSRCLETMEERPRLEAVRRDGGSGGREIETQTRPPWLRPQSSPPVETCSCSPFAATLSSAGSLVLPWPESLLLPCVAAAARATAASAASLIEVDGTGSFGGGGGGGDRMCSSSSASSSAVSLSVCA